MKLVSSILTGVGFASIVGASITVTSPAEAARCLYIAHHSNGLRIADGGARARNKRVACRRAKRRCERESQRKIRRMRISSRGAQCRCQ